MRILSQLYGMWKGLPDSQTYLNRIATDLGMPPRMVAQQAGTALQLLLHNDHYFRVDTIDTFFQRVLRNLARELDNTWVVDENGNKRKLRKRGEENTHD